MQNKLISRLLRERFLYIILFLSISSISIFLNFPNKTLGNFTLYVLFIICFLEVLIRLILWIENGNFYNYSLFFYSLRRDKLYGYRFKKNILARNLGTKVSDKFLHRWSFENEKVESSNSNKKVNFSTDEFGYREGNNFFKSVKPRLKIFCCGGSTTSCDGVDNTSTWPSILERELNKDGFNVEVTNAGVPGWHSYQDLLLIKNEILNFKPDIILLHQGWNEEFEFSSLNLGKWWKKQTARNELESNFLYTPKNKVLSQKLSLLLLLTIRSLSWDFIFKKKMSFTNINRWKCLLSEKYLEAWFFNIVEIAKLCKASNVLLFTLDYPSLLDVKDSDFERNFFLQNPIFTGRLTPDFADYQAISKLGISYFLKDISNLVPNLDASAYVNEMNCQQRAMQFGDEIHFSSLGCNNFGKEVARLLSINPDFISRENGGIKISNVKTDSGEHKINLEQIVASRKFIHRLINKKILKLELDGSKVSRVINSERYTTF